MNPNPFRQKGEFSNTSFGGRISLTKDEEEKEKNEDDQIDEEKKWRWTIRKKKNEEKGEDE